MKVEQIERLTGIIADKGWANFDFLAHPSKSIYDALIDMLKHLPNLEINLTLDLLENYRIVKDYTAKARCLMQEIKNNCQNNKVVITPIINYNSQRIKSGQALHY